ncbi:MAG: hypothetical protein EOM66_01150 [Clostridia bacterium]|nr:hypothetical protein [Clostridia bacterium]
MFEPIHNQKTCPKERGSYGKHGSIAANGCGAIAVYNACLMLGYPVPANEIFPVLGKSALLGGRMGTNPFALRRYLKGRGIRLHTYWQTASIKRHEAYIVLYIFRRGCRLFGHYIALAPQGKGFMALNDGAGGQPRRYEALSDIKKIHGALFLWILGLR